VEVRATCVFVRPCASARRQPWFSSILRAKTVLFPMRSPRR
jgi:hypothetical protein